MAWTCSVCKESNHDDMRRCACGYDSEKRIEERISPIVVKQEIKQPERNNTPRDKATGQQANSPLSDTKIKEVQDQTDAWTWLKLNGALVGWGAVAITVLCLLLASGFKALPFMLFTAVAIMLIIYVLDAIKVRDAWVGLAAIVLVFMGLLLSWKYIADVFYYKPGRIIPQYFTSSMSPSGIGTRQTGYEFEIGVSGQGFGGFFNRSLTRLSQDRIYRLFDDNAIDELKNYPDDPRVKEYFRKLEERDEVHRQKNDTETALKIKTAKRQELVRQIEQYKKNKKWQALVSALEKEVEKMDKEAAKAGK